MKRQDFLLTMALTTIFALPLMAQNNNIFSMVRSKGVVTAGCLPDAAGRVTIHPLGVVEAMHVEVTGLPPNTDFDLFLIQLPNAPFGISVYQGDINTDSKGIGVGDFIGEFSKESFIVAPGAAPAPVVFGGPFPDASINPATNPVQIYHLGLWFDSPEAAYAAGCNSVETPFNGTHNAGIQVLNTSNFGNLNGPLQRIP